MSRLAILVTVQAFVSCLFVGVVLAEDVRLQETSLSKSDALNLARPIDKQIIIRTQLFEVSLSKMRHLGVDISTFDGRIVQVFDGADFIAGVTLPGSCLGIMDALRKNGIARILAAATIATVDRQPASLSCVSTIKVGSRPNVDNESETKFIGTKLEVVPQVVDNRQLNIELHLDWSGIDESSKADHGATPKIRHCRIVTTIQATFGETFVLSGLLQIVRKGDQREETTLVLMVTPEWADGKPADERKPLHVSQATSHDSTGSK